MIRQTYFLDAASLTDATTVYLDQGLTVFAPDGYYSDGVITRELVSNVFLPQQICEYCGVPCPVTPVFETASVGFYELNIGAFANLGAIIIRFNSNFGEINGLKVTFNSIVYNEVISPVDGRHISTDPFGYTYFGMDTCGINGTYDDMNRYLFDGTTFILTPPNVTTFVSPGDVSASLVNPGNVMMVIPKTFSGVSNINVLLASLCWNEQTLNFDIGCPTLLTSFPSSSVAVSSEVSCLYPMNQNYYNASISGTPGTVDIYDLVFSDPYGLTRLAAGFYKATGHIIGGNDWFEVDSNGMVVDLGICVGGMVYEGNVWFGYDPATGINACDNESPNEYLYWSTQQAFYSGLEFYTDPSLTNPYVNSNIYTRCRSNAFGGGIDEYELVGNVLGVYTRTC